MAKYDLKRLAARFAGRPALLSVSVVAGAAINTNIAVTGTNVEDALVAVLEVQPPTAVGGNTILADRIAEAKITSAGNIQLTTTNTTGNQLLVLWYKVRP